MGLFGPSSEAQARPGWDSVLRTVTDFSDVRALLEHAQQRAAQFDVLADAAAAPSSYDIDVTAETHKRLATLKYHEPLGQVTTRLAIALAEAVHTFRVCLDHLAYQLAVRDAGSDPPPNERRIMFPIVADHQSFVNLQGRLVDLAPRSVQFLEKQQEYKRRSFDDDARYLLILDEIENLAKHRKLHPVLHVPTGVKVTPARDPGDVDLDIQFRHGPLEQETLFAVFQGEWIRPTDTFVFEPRLVIGVPNEPTFRGSCSDILAGIDRRVTKVVQTAEASL